MGHYAHITDGVVDQVIVADRAFIDSGIVGDPTAWIKTSYNTRGGKHFKPDTWEEDDGAPIRKNYAGIGYIYDAQRDAFIPPKPHEDAKFDEESCLWDMSHIPVADFYALEEEV